jgi:O-antigen/teichoic acid export membrane protein
MMVPSPLTVSSSAAGSGALRTHLGDPLYRTGYLLTLGTASTAVLGFAFWVLAARAYPASVVGVASATISAMMLVSGVSSLGMNAVLVRYLPTAGRRTRALVVAVYAITVTLSLTLGAAAALTSARWAPRLRFLADDSGWCAGFTVATALWTLFSLQDGVLTGMRSASWVPIENGLFALAKLALLVALAPLLPFAGPFVAWNVPVAIAVTVVSVLIFRRLLSRPVASAAGDLDVGRLVRTAIGNYGGSVITVATVTCLPVLVANVRSAAETAYFYVPWTIASVVQSISGNMTLALMVEAAHDEAELRRLCRRTLALCLRLIVPIAVAGSLAAPLLLGAFGRPYADAGGRLLRLLLVAAVPNVLVTLGVAIARLEHRGEMVLAIQGAHCAAVLGLGTVLLHGTLGIDGIGVAWLASQLVVATALAAGPLRWHLLAPRSRA